MLWHKEVVVIWEVDYILKFQLIECFGKNHCYLCLQKLLLKRKKLQNNIQIVINILKNMEKSRIWFPPTRGISQIISAQADVVNLG